MSDLDSDANSINDEEPGKCSDGSSGRGHRKTYKQISDELRKMIVMSIENGSCSRKKAAETFNVPYGSVVAIYKRFLDTGKTHKKKNDTDHSKKLNAEHKEFLLSLVTENCQCTMKFLKEQLQERFEVKMSVTTISRSIPAFIYSIQRMRPIYSETVTPQQLLERKVYCEHFLCVNNSERLIIYFGEVDFKITMRQLARRETPGVGPQIINPTIKHRTKTVMAAISKTELLQYKVVKGPASNDTLIEYMTALFGLLEKRSIVGAVIIIDDGIFNRYQDIKDLIEQAGHLLLILTENCPFLNPVENLMTKWVKFMRSSNFHSETEMESLVNSFKKIVKEKHCSKYCRIILENAHRCVSDTVLDNV